VHDLVRNAACQWLCKVAAHLGRIFAMPALSPDGCTAAGPHRTVDSQVWGQACTAAGAANTAATIRLLLPTSVPPRLLLPALVAHLPTAQVSSARKLHITALQLGVLSTALFLGTGLLDSCCGTLAGQAVPHGIAIACAWAVRPCSSLMSSCGNPPWSPKLLLCLVSQKNT